MRSGQPSCYIKPRTSATCWSWNRTLATATESVGSGQPSRAVGDRGQRGCGFLPVWHPIFLPPIFGAFPSLPASLCSFLAFRRIEARYFFAVSLNFQFCSYRGPGTGTHGLDIGLNWELPRRIAFTLVVAGLRVKMFHYFPYQGFLPVKLSAQ